MTHARIGKQEILILRERLVEHLRAGGDIKSFAIDNGYGTDNGWIYKCANKMGWSSFYLSAAEKQMIIKLREQNKKRIGQ